MSQLDRDIKFTKESGRLIKKLGAYHMIGHDEWEPQRNNNFEVHIYGLESLTSVEGGKTYGADEIADSLTLAAVSVGGINTNVGIIQIPYGNTKVKYAGLPEISNSDIVYNDYIGKNTERIISAWHGLVFNPKTETIGRASVYKKPGVLIETAPDGTCARIWQLKGCWPSNVQYGGYDYNGGNTRQITMTLTYDIAIPLDYEWDKSLDNGVNALRLRETLDREGFRI